MLIVKHEFFAKIFLFPYIKLLNSRKLIINKSHKNIYTFAVHF